MSKLIECIPNFSEGRRPEVIEEIVAAITASGAATLLDKEMDPDHNRAVVTFVCHPDLMESLVFGRANALGSAILGQRAAVAALKSKDKWLSALRSKVQENIQYLVGRLGPLGVTFTGHSNSVNVSLPARCSAADIAAQMESRGIEVADGTKFYGMEGYDANYLHVAVSVPRSWLERFCTLFEELISE